MPEFLAQVCLAAVWRALTQIRHHEVRTDLIGFMLTGQVDASGLYPLTRRLYQSMKSIPLLDACWKQFWVLSNFCVEVASVGFTVFDQLAVVRAVLNGQADGLVSGFASLLSFGHRF
jgi:hypothetical protein